MTTRTRLSYADAAEAVLRRHSPGAPLHYRRITELAVEEHLVRPGGVTPEASMNAAIRQDIKRRAAREHEQRFRAYGGGRYGLALPTGPLGGAVEAHNAK